jgi:hypothetical protein
LKRLLLVLPWLLWSAIAHAQVVISGGGVGLIPEVTVAELGAPRAGTARTVTDGNDATDCTSGGGSVRVLCSFNGSVWAALTGGIVEGGSGDVDSVTAGTGLTGGGVAGALTINAAGTAPITVAADAIECPTCGVTTGTLGQFAATTSEQLAGVLSDEEGGSGGFVRAGGNVATATALAANPTDCGEGEVANAIDASGNLGCVVGASSSTINAQTDVTYTVLDADRGKLVTFTNAAAVTVSLPDAAGAGFDAGWVASFVNLGVGDVTIVPVTSTFQASEPEVVLATGVFAEIRSDGTNYVYVKTGAVAEADTPQTVYVRGKTTTNHNSFANAARFEDGSENGISIYTSGGVDPKLTCYIGGVENDCDKIVSLNSGKTFALINSTDTELLAVTEAGVVTGAAKRIKSAWFGAGSLSTDGTQCAAPAEVTINSGPKIWTIICTDNDSSTIYGSVGMPDSWDGGTVTFEHQYIQTAANTGALNGDIAAQCRGATEVPSSTWGTEVAIDDAAVTGTNAIDHTTSAAVTPAGTCAGGDTLFFRYQVDATGTTTTAASLHHVGFKMEYSATWTD